MAEKISVPFEVVWDSGLREGYEADTGAWAEVKFKCDWDDRVTLVNELVGTSLLQNPQTGQITTVFPYRYPGSPNLVARSIPSIEPFGNAKLLDWLPLGKWVSRKQAIVTCRFEYPKFTESGQQDASGKPYTQTTINLSGEIVTLPNTAYRFADGAYNSTPVGIPLPQAQISFKRYMLPYLPVFEMLSILGGVNGGPFTFGNFTAPIGTVLFCGGASEVTLNTDGSVLQSVDYQFLFRPVPWGWALSPRTGEWTPLLNVINGNPPVNYVDFNILP